MATYHRKEVTMSPRTGQLLLDGVRPIIRASLAKGAVKTVGCEDLQELEADGMAQAANMLESAELAGKEVSASSVAFYALQALKSGRRYGCCGRSDVMSSATQIDGKLRYGLGQDAMADCVRESPWQGGLRAHREKRACRYM
jgi:hypothetical protein